MPWRTDTSAFSTIYGMDPYADWLLNRAVDEFTRRHEPGESDPFIPFVVALLSDKAVEVMKHNAVGHDPSDPDYLPIFIPKLNSPFERKSHISAFALRQFFLDLPASTLPLYVEFRDMKKRIKLGLPLKHDQQQDPKKTAGSGAELTRPGALHGLAGGAGVISGVIDDGIAFVNDRFRSSNGNTRIAFFWRQDGRFDGERTPQDHGRDPDKIVSTVPYGREIAAKRSKSGAPGIDDLIAKHTYGGIIDEDQVYAEFGSMDFADPRDHKPVALRWAHGTHVLDLAAGYPMAQAPSDRPIIAVQLPVATTADTSGTTLEVYLKHAINYIWERAYRIDPTGMTPLVINFSYGLTAGPHDGTSLLEREIENGLHGPHNNHKGESVRRPVTFFLPAGNAQLSRAHARVSWNGDRATLQDDPAELPWRVTPNNLTTSHLEIWMPMGSGDRVRLEIVSPDGECSDLLCEKHGAELVLYADDGSVVAIASYSSEVPPTSRGLFQISLRPTEHQRRRNGQPDAPAGVWLVRLHKGPDYVGEEIEAWIQRNDTPFGYPVRARQSYFDDWCYERFDEASGRPLEYDAPQPCYVKRVSLINALATSCRPVVVGGVSRQDLQPSDYSAGGPTWTWCHSPELMIRKIGPDVAGVSDDSRIHRGVLAAGSRSGSAFTLSGTSVAAPQVAKWAADHGGNKLCVIHEAEHEETANRPKLIREREGAGRIVIPSDRPPRIDD